MWASSRSIIIISIWYQIVSHATYQYRAEINHGDRGSSGFHLLLKDFQNQSSIFVVNNFQKIFLTVTFLATFENYSDILYQCLVWVCNFLACLCEEMPCLSQPSLCQFRLSCWALLWEGQWAVPVLVLAGILAVCTLLPPQYLFHANWPCSVRLFWCRMKQWHRDILFVLCNNFCLIFAFGHFWALSFFHNTISYGHILKWSSGVYNFTYSSLGTFLQWKFVAVLQLFGITMYICPSLSFVLILSTLDNYMLPAISAC